MLYILNHGSDSGEKLAYKVLQNALVIIFSKHEHFHSLNCNTKPKMESGIRQTRNLGRGSFASINYRQATIHTLRFKRQGFISVKERVGLLFMTDPPPKFFNDHSESGPWSDVSSSYTTKDIASVNSSQAFM